MHTIRTDVAIIGGGLGGCAAALALARLGYRVVLTEATDWVGGQWTCELAPPDEHRWIESFGATESYRALRRAIREHYRAHFPLSASARASPALNPGNGWVSRLCHDPRVALAALHATFAPHEAAGRLRVLTRHVPFAAWRDGDAVSAVAVRDLETGRERVLVAAYYLDATPLGELLDLAGVEHVVGAESRAETGEPHAAETADPRAQQAFTVAFAVEHAPGEDHTIERPAQYTRWREYYPSGWTGPLLGWTSPDPETHEPLTRRLFDAAAGQSLWTYRRILDRENFAPGFARSDVTVVNWPQNDFFVAPLVGVDAAERARNLEAARQLSLSLLYWLQTEAPRPDGGAGYPGLTLREDLGGPDGLARGPYVRESRRIRAEFTVREQHIARALRADGAEPFHDTVGVGCYRLDLHPRVGGAGYLDAGCWPFQIPLGALVPVRVENVLPAGKNLGVTHVANGAFRVHPVEWNAGESAGLLAAFCLARRTIPRAVLARESLLEAFQALLHAQGVELTWPSSLEPM